MAKLYSYMFILNYTDQPNSRFTALLLLASNNQCVFYSLVFRENKDPKDRRERWDLLARKETRVGPANLVKLDLRVKG